MVVDPKRKAVLERISSLEEAIRKAHQYLESGANAHWHGFRPLFKDKTRGGEVLPPHKDWVKSVFLPRTERTLAKAEKALERLERPPKRGKGREED